MTIPWQPLFTIERSKQPEVTVYGIVSVLEGRKAEYGVFHPVVEHGDVNAPLWSRSVLKPWQFINHADVLKKAYPSLTEEQLAIMIASHSAEELHQEILQSLMDLSGIDESYLGCPLTMPLSTVAKEKVRSQGGSQRRLYHNCSGKHLGFLMAIKAQGGDMRAYLDPNGSQFDVLKQSLAAILGRPEGSFLTTTDGCQLPNYALSAREIATLYGTLLNPSFAEAAGSTLANQCVEAGSLMLKHPRVIGGKDRVDTQLMQGKLFGDGALKMVAKEGADGLLAIGIGPVKQYPEGLGMLVKLSSGFDRNHMLRIVAHILKELGLVDSEYLEERQEGLRYDHIEITFHFDVKSYLVYSSDVVRSHVSSVLATGPVGAIR